MARKVGDINAKVAYLTSSLSGPKLKVKRPIYLRNQLNSKGKKKNAQAPCQDEMSDFFDCMKKNEFKNEACQEQFLKYYECGRAHQKNLRLGKKSPEDLKYQKNTAALRKYPNPTDKDALTLQRNMYKTDRAQRSRLMPHTQSTSNDDSK